MIFRAKWSDFSSIQIIQDYLRSRHVVLTTTDTVPGLLTMCNNMGREALDRIKGRSEKPYLILATKNGVKELIDSAKMPQEKCVKMLMEQCWPGPLTLIMPAHQSVHACMRSAQGAIAIRVPHHSGLQALLQKTGPLFSTSANLAGKPTPQHIDEVSGEVAKLVACIIDDESEGEKMRLASTLVDCTRSHLRVIREGAYKAQVLQEITGDACWGV